uniref:VPS13 middle RBG modules domain-containing protein n=1 Tax=Parascaris equorum TaxID=6256 RepID=A0A914S5S0_PAREQ
MEALALCVGKLQYQDLLLFLEAQERFNTATRYLKYRPSVNEYQGHYKQWWGGAEKKKDEQKPSAGDIVSQFEQAMTPEEKAKLFEAIDYQENTPPTDYPKHFVENVITVELKSLMVVIENALRLRLTAAAMTRYEEVKTRSVTGLAHAVETKTKLVLDICIAPATIVISETGIFDENRAALVTDLGTLTITTIEDDRPLATDIHHSV